MAFTDFPIPTIPLSSLPAGSGYISNYTSLAAAISAIGSTPTTLFLDQDTAVSTAAVIPATMIVVSLNQSVFTKSGSGTLEFAGFGLQDPLSQQPIFSGFGAGNVTWTGADAPTEVSAELWDPCTASLTTRLQCANDAFPAKRVKIIAYPRTITGTVTFSQYRDIYFTDGEYLNTIDTNIQPFKFVDDFSASGDLGALIWVSGTGGSGFGPVNVSNALQNIFFERLNFQGPSDAVGDPGNSVIILGNANNGYIRDCTFTECLQFTVVGGDSSTGNRAKNVDVTRNRWINCSTQALAIINGTDIILQDNYFDVQNITTTHNCTLIDIEPNDPRDLIDNLSIINNTFDMRSASGMYINGIVVQGVSLPQVSNVVCRGNILIGELGSGFLNGIVAYGVNQITIAGNTIKYGAGAIEVRNCGDVWVSDNEITGNGDVSGLNSPIHIFAVANGEITRNSINIHGVHEGAGIYEREIEVAVTTNGSTVTCEGTGFYLFWEGLSVLINNTAYIVDTVTPIPPSVPTQDMTTTASIGVLNNAVMESRSGDTIEVTDHGFLDGAAVRYIAGTSPISGLTDGVTYYIIKVTNDTFKLATTLANALANTAITLSSSGTGTQTFKPILQTRFSNNKYIYNDVSTITLEPTGTSVIAPIVYV